MRFYVEDPASRSGRPRKGPFPQGKTNIPAILYRYVGPEGGVALSDSSEPTSAILELQQLSNYAGLHAFYM